MRRGKAIKVTRKQIELEMDYYFNHGGEIHVLPAQVFIPINRVNCASPYLDYRESGDDYSPLSTNSLRIR